MAEFVAIDVVRVSGDDQHVTFEERISGCLRLILMLGGGGGWLVSMPDSTLKVAMQVCEDEVDTLLALKSGGEAVIVRKGGGREWRNKIGKE